MSDLRFEGFNVVAARRITELESQNGELIKDLKDLVDAVKTQLDPLSTIYKDMKVTQILDRIEMKRGVLFV